MPSVDELTIKLYQNIDVAALSAAAQRGEKLSYLQEVARTIIRDVPSPQPVRREEPRTTVEQVTPVPEPRRGRTQEPSTRRSPPARMEEDSCRVSEL